MGKKKIIIILGIFLIISIVVLAIVLKENNSIFEKKVLDLSQLFNIENIENNDINLIKSQEEIAKKYKVQQKQYDIYADVKFDETNGKMIFLREQDNNANIYQTKYELSKGEEGITQVKDNMQKFMVICTKFLQLESTHEPYSTKQYGENIEQDLVPIEEGIYSKGRLYTVTYRMEKENEINDYDVNFYRNGDNLICEFAHIL